MGGRGRPGWGVKSIGWKDWKGNSSVPQKRPAGLKGKEIGLYYRDMQKQKKITKHAIKFKMPSAILSALEESIKSIREIAHKENIPLSPIKKICFSQNFMSQESKTISQDVEKTSIADKPSEDNLDSMVDEFKIPTASNVSEPSTSKYTVSNNYVASTSNNTGTTSQIDYKYGYDDIISGTFEEKLVECLAMGIDIIKNNEQINKINNSLKTEYFQMIEEPKYKNMREFREKLPTYKKSEELLNIIKNNQVVVISGETGCGKSTQVPQLILDDAILKGRGANVKILVTQPRRIAASSLAMRVAEERAESLGNSVGYAVRLEKVDCRPRGSIFFCTTGVLLVELELSQSLASYSHIILDEVHERDCQIDIAMCMLKQVLQKRNDLKLILMSATIDAETLCQYYDNCPMLHIEGLAYPVKDVYLEEILHMTRYKLPDETQNRNMKPWMNKRGNMRGKKGLLMQYDIQYKAEIESWLESIKHNIDKDVYLTLQDSRIEQLDMDLIVELLLCITRGEPGAVLIFLPGISEITKLMRLMQDSLKFPEHLYEIHPLHSKLPTLTQHRIFKRPPGNVRKIIIATNIAETSITIDDIVYVIDCGKLKLKGLNVHENVSTLQIKWVSQANMRQRRGRAGRCQPGICYHVMSSYRASTLEERIPPELQRSDLLEPVLQIKRLRLGMAEEALKMMPGVPDEKTIKNAVRHLQQCGALDSLENLTPLGWHLARLPVHPAAGKLLLLGALFGCLDRAASVAAVWGFKDPFLLVIGKEIQADDLKRELAMGEPSDHIAISEAIMRWEALTFASQRRAFAYNYFLSDNTLKLLSDMKRQFGDNLKQMGFLPSGDVYSRWANRNSGNLSLFKAIIAASLYPNTAAVRWSNSRNPRKVPNIRVRTPDGKVRVHPSSIMSMRSHPPRPLCENPGANWLVYWLKQRSTDLYLLEVTLVYSLPLLFFGEFDVSAADSPHECVITINTMMVCCDKQTAQVLFDLRALLDKVLATKIMMNTHEARESTAFEEQVLKAVTKLITAEDEGVEYCDDLSESDTDCTDDRKWR